jgi:bla regulator protein BlaR1
MRATRHLAAAFALLTLASLAQTAQPKPELLLFHPSGPPLSYEVATIKPVDPNTADRVVRLPPGAARSTSLSPLSMRRYIMNAYGAMYAAQVVGGPDWLDKDAYNIKGKVPDDIEAAFQTMKRDDQLNQNRSMQQSLLADRFHLKAHFETRVLPVYEIVPAKGGLKITEVPAPPERKPGDPPIQMRTGDPLPPGSMRTMMNSNGLRIVDARAIQMQLFARIIGGDAGDRPIVDHSGVAGYFDVTDLTWAPLGDAAATTTSPDAPSLAVALQEKLGLKLVPAKDPIEVLVIDSIDRPTEN